MSEHTGPCCQIVQSRTRIPSSGNGIAIPPRGATVHGTARSSLSPRGGLDKGRRPGLKAPMQTIQTVTGTCRPDQLGRTLVHEHLLIGYPGWQMDALAPRFERGEALRRAIDEMHRLRSFGVCTFLDPCPMDLGRDVEFMAEVAQASGMRIICTTGAYFEEQGLTYTFRNLPLDDIAAIYE